MNRQEIKEHVLELVDAKYDGKTIESLQEMPDPEAKRRGREIWITRWEVALDLSLSRIIREPCRYRVKPEPTPKVKVVAHERISAGTVYLSVEGSEECHSRDNHQDDLRRVTPDLSGEES